MRTLLRSIGSEYLKVFTTRMWWILAIVLVVYVAATAGGLAALFGYLSENPEAATGGGGGGGVPPVGALQPLVYGFAVSIGYAFPVLLGALATTGEFRHETLTPTFLATPRRGLVLTAKVKVMFVFGAIFGALAFIGSVGAGAGAFYGFGIDTQLDDPDIWALVGRGILAMAIWAVVGVGLGAVVRNQVAAIVIVLAFTQFVEPLLRVAAGFLEATAGIGRFLPGSASDALVGASFYSLTGATQTDQLDWWQGGLVLLAYAVVLTVIGYFSSWRRDVS